MEMPVEMPVEMPAVMPVEMPAVMLAEPPRAAAFAFAWHHRLFPRRPTPDA